MICWSWRIVQIHWLFQMGTSTEMTLLHSAYPIMEYWSGLWLAFTVLRMWECLSWMNWASWRAWWLEAMVSGLVVVNEVMVLIELWIVQNSNPFRLVKWHSGIIIHLNWTISLLFNPLILVIGVSIMLHHSHWLVWLMDWFEFTDLPQLQSVKHGGWYAFQMVHTVVFESDWMDGMMIQICLNYNPFNLMKVLLIVIMAVIERRKLLNPTTSRTHWQCEVWLNELMNK